MSKYRFFVDSNGNIGVKQDGQTRMITKPILNPVLANKYATYKKNVNNILLYKDTVKSEDVVLSDLTLKTLNAYISGREYNKDEILDLYAEKQVDTTSKEFDITVENSVNYYSLASDVLEYLMVSSYYDKKEFKVGNYLIVAHFHTEDLYQIDVYKKSKKLYTLDSEYLANSSALSKLEELSELASVASYGYKYGIDQNKLIKIKNAFEEYGKYAENVKEKLAKLEKNRKEMHTFIRKENEFDRLMKLNKNTIEACEEMENEDKENINNKIKELNKQLKILKLNVEENKDSIKEINKLKKSLLNHCSVYTTKKAEKIEIRNELINKHKEYAIDFCNKHNIKYTLIGEYFESNIDEALLKLNMQELSLKQERVTGVLDVFESSQALKEHIMNEAIVDVIKFYKLQIAKKEIISKLTDEQKQKIVGCFVNDCLGAVNKFSNNYDNTNVTNF